MRLATTNVNSSIPELAGYMRNMNDQNKKKCFRSADIRYKYASVAFIDSSGF